MQIQKIYPLGQITIKRIRDFISDHHLSDDATILLNQADFDEISVEYRETYYESMQVPFKLLGILIEEDYTGQVPQRKIAVIQNQRYQ